ncbi:MAG: orotate phosphoribosyltransferase [Candidatus Tenebribacter burtonii]|nr:orotate phosphoribosyltransferase [Candidatus Tenebribacter burtonii]
MQLAKEINSCSKLTGDFLLRSGVKSDTYFDKYKFESYPNLLKKIAQKITELVPKDTEIIAGLEMGGIPLATMVSQILCIPTAFIRKDAKKYGTCKYAEGAELIDRKVIIIEDVVSSGGAIINAVTKMRKDGIEVDKAICVIDRETGGKEKLKDIDIELLSVLTRTDLNNNQ